MKGYLAQQKGYGEAEALLMRKHPENFNSLGGSLWRGRIYASSKFGLLLRPAFIYRGLFGSAGFQGLYAAQPAVALMRTASLEYHLLIELPLWLLSALFPYFLPLAVAATLLPVAVCAAAGMQAEVPKHRSGRGRGR